jgi:RNA polymerase sigma factor (TIGR02999 family)
MARTPSDLEARAKVARRYAVGNECGSRRSLRGPLTAGHAGLCHLPASHVMADEELPRAGMPAPPDSADAKARLFASLYADLRRMAQRQLGRSAAQDMISPTTLLHESYLSFAANKAQFPDEARFLGYASRVMRGLLIDLMRERLALKRGGAFLVTRLDTSVSDSVAAIDEMTRLADAIDDLAAHDPRLAELVNLRYFCGYTFDEIAGMRGCSVKTLQRDWEKARLMLFEQLNDAS